MSLANHQMVVLISFNGQNDEILSHSQIHHLAIYKLLRGGVIRSVASKEVGLYDMVNAFWSLMI